MLPPNANGKPSLYGLPRASVNELSRELASGFADLPAPRRAASGAVEAKFRARKA
jgi:hypothetical protein